MILTRLYRKIKKVIGYSQIEEVRNSKYFDSEYYLENNPDIKAANIDPATHFYYHGWQESRKPSFEFDIERFLLNYPEVKRLRINPISYILNKNLQKKVDGTYWEKKITVSSLLKAYFKETIPLNTLPVELSEIRINIVFNGFDSSCFFGGKATALILVVKFAQNYGYKLRIIAQNPEKKLFYEFLNLFNLTFEGDIEFYSTESSNFLEISSKDHFLCTMWSNADSVLNTKAVQGKIFYIMQEVETLFYDQGDYRLRCYNTLTNNSLIPIVNSKLLYDFLLNDGYFNLRNGIYFEPAFSRDLLKPVEGSFKKKKKYKLFFYARPSHQRNLFYFGLDILNKAFLTGALEPKEWEIDLAGDETVPDFNFDADIKVNRLGVMSWRDYCINASKVDLCFSLMYTPHPSYPPLDMACSGAVVVTNKYLNKQDLQMYSKNILCAELNEEDILLKLKEGASLSKDVAKRKENYLNSNIKDSWDDSFSKVISFMGNKIKESENE